MQDLIFHLQTFQIYSRHYTDKPQLLVGAAACTLLIDNGGEIRRFRSLKNQNCQRRHQRHQLRNRRPRHRRG